MVTRFRLGDQGNTIRFARLEISYSILYSYQTIYAVSSQPFIQYILQVPVPRAEWP